MLTTADRIYFSQFLIFSENLEQAISILKDVVEQEGDFSISMVIWPKELYASHILDESLRNELIKSSEDYIVFPTNLYARYLLTIAYSSLGQEENASNNLLNSSFFLTATHKFKNLFDAGNNVDGPWLRNKPDLTNSILPIPGHSLFNEIRINRHFIIPSSNSSHSGSVFGYSQLSTSENYVRYEQRVCKRTNYIHSVLQDQIPAHSSI